MYGNGQKAVFLENLGLKQKGNLKPSYTIQCGSSLGFTTVPVILDSSAANVSRCVSKDTSGPVMENNKKMN